jgi:RNA recognition motif-containing protein
MDAAVESAPQMEETNNAETKSNEITNSENEKPVVAGDSMETASQEDTATQDNEAEMELGEIEVDAEDDKDMEIEKPARETTFKVPYAKREINDSQDAEDENNRCLGVFGLSNETSQKDLKDHFQKFGKIEHVHLITDSRTCVSKGFGFVTFEMHEDAAYAKQKNQRRQTAQTNDPSRLFKNKRTKTKNTRRLQRTCKVGRRTS